MEFSFYLLVLFMEKSSSFRHTIISLFGFFILLLHNLYEFIIKSNNSCCVIFDPLPVRVIPEPRIDMQTSF